MEYVRHDPNAPTDRADFIACWVELLFDPLTKQARKVLKSSKTGGMCCLGVACTVANIEPEKISGNQYVFAGQVESLPQNVCKFLKMHDEMGAIRVEERRIDRSYLSEKQLHHKNHNLESLAKLNDHGATFRTIGKIIQDKAHFLFKELTREEHEYIMKVQPPAWETVLEKRRTAKASSQNSGQKASTKG